MLFDTIVPLSTSVTAPEYELSDALDGNTCMLDGSRTQGSPKSTHAENGWVESHLVFRRRQVWQADGVRLVSSEGITLCCSIWRLRISLEKILTEFLANRCLLHIYLRAKLRSQIKHLCGREDVWLSRWRLRCSLRRKDLLQSGFLQTKGPDNPILVVRKDDMAWWLFKYRRGTDYLSSWREASCLTNGKLIKRLSIAFRDKSLKMNRSRHFNVLYNGQSCTTYCGNDE